MKVKYYAMSAISFVCVSCFAQSVVCDFQKLIDEAAAKGGGKVVVPAGIHDTKSLRLRSGVELHLEKGAVLRGSTDYKDYFDFPEEVCKVRPEFSGRVLVYAWNEENISITGEGTIDGQGPEFFPQYKENPLSKGMWPKPDVPRPRLVQFVKCRNIKMKDTTFMNSPGWAMLIRLCENIEVDNIRVESDQRIINSDGIDFDSCKRVRVGNSYFKTGDDCLILRAMREKKSDSMVCEDIVVSNCFLDSSCQTIRIGCPSDDTIRNALFKNIRAKGRNGIFFDYPVRYVRSYDEGYVCVSNIVFDGYTGSLRGSAVQIIVEDGVKIRGVKNIAFKNINVKSKEPLRFITNTASPVENITFENVESNGKKKQDGEVKVKVRPSKPLKRGNSKSWEALCD